MTIEICRKVQKRLLKKGTVLKIAGNIKCLPGFSEEKLHSFKVKLPASRKENTV
jgi:hypothetical protein